MDLDEFRERFQQRRAEAYARFFTPVTDGFIEAIVGAAGEPGDRILDLGCGPGSLGPALRKAGFAVIAADREPAMAALAKRSASAPVIVADALRLPFSDKTFDTVVAAFLLPHVPDLMAGLAEVRRILRPSGRVVMTGWADPTRSPFTGLAGSLLQQRAASFEREALAEAARRTDPDYLSQAVETTGFDRPAVSTLAATVTQPSALAWWNGLASASSGFADLLRAQPPDIQREVRAAFLAAATEFAAADGNLQVRVTAHLVTAQIR